MAGLRLIGRSDGAYLTPPQAVISTDLNVVAFFFKPMAILSGFGELKFNNAI